MALKTDPISLLSEYDDGVRLRDATLRSASAMMREYQGRHHRDDRSPEDPVPVPHFFEWIATVTPQVIYSNPQVTAEAAASGVDRRSMIRLKHGVNRRIQDTDAWWQLMMVWYDQCFGFGVVRTGVEQLPGFKGDSLGRRPHGPVLYRLAPHLYFQDSKSGQDRRRARLRGHMTQRDYSDMLKDPTFNKKAVEDLARDVGSGLYNQDPTATGYAGGPDKGNGDSSESPERGVVNYLEIHVPEHHLPGYEDNPQFNGTIFTVGFMNSSKKTGKRSEPLYIRDPFPFFGPKSGPYEVFGTYHIPDQVFPLSPMAATYEQVKQVNAHEAALTRSASRKKKFIGVDSGNKEAGKIIKKAVDGFVYVIPGLQTGAVKQMEFGGADSQDYAHIEHLHQQLERSSGLDDAARGMIDSNATATAVAAAGSARGNRTEMIKSMYQDSTTRCLNKMAWYAWHMDSADWQLGPAAAEELHPRPKSLPGPEMAEEIAQTIEISPEAYPMLSSGLAMIPLELRTEKIREELEWQPDLWLRKGYGPFKGYFDNVMIKIEAMSMERTTEPLVQKRALDFMNIITQAAPVMRMHPEIDWVTLLSQVGQTMNQKNVGDLINVDLQKQLGEMAMQQQMGEGQGGGANNAPQQTTGANGSGYPIIDLDGNATQPAQTTQARMIGSQAGKMSAA